MKSIAADAVKEVMETNHTRLERTTEKIERKRKADQVTFLKKGNEVQYKHGKEIEDTIDDALELLDEGDMDKVRQKLTDCKKIIQTRAKHLVE